MDDRNDAPKKTGEVIQIAGREGWNSHSAAIYLPKNTLINYGFLSWKVADVDKVLLFLKRWGCICEVLVCKKGFPLVLEDYKRYVNYVSEGNWYRKLVQQMFGTVGFGFERCVRNNIVLVPCKERLKGSFVLWEFCCYRRWINGMVEKLFSFHAFNTGNSWHHGECECLSGVLLSAKV